MSFEIQKKIIESQMAESQLIYDFDFLGGGGVQLAWHGTYRQLYLTRQASPGAISFHFSGFFFGSENYQEILKMPNVGGNLAIIEPYGWFTPSNTNDPRYAINQPYKELRVDDATIISASGEIIKFDAHIDYNTNGKDNAVVVLCSGVNLDKK